MKRFIFTLTALFALNSAAFAEMQETNLKITGMFSEKCVLRIQETLENTPGVASANVNLLKNKATVQYDSAQTSPEKLAEVVTGSGFETAVSR